MTVTNPTNASKEDVSITWHSLNAEEVQTKLHTSFEQGLTTQEAEARLQKYGPNQLDEKPRPTFLQLLYNQLKSFIVILLIVAAVVSALLGEWVDSSAILAIVVLNAVLGVVQESRAEQSLAALKKLSAPEAHVVRDGQRISVPSSTLVPGDVVFVEAGSLIPADLRLVEAVNLRVEEAALTGESVPVQKDAALQLDGDIPLGDRKNTVFMGTIVNYGRGKGVVVSTGMNTQLGMIADMLQAVEDEETPLQKKLDQLGKVLGIAALIVCALVFLVGMYRSGFALDTLVHMFMISVSLAIAAVPEGLPAVVTISLALGMREMVNRHALIRKLSSVETLGSATVICSDKTGTLTQNEMTVTDVWVDGKTFKVSGTGYEPKGEFSLDGSKIDPAVYPGLTSALWVGVLNNDAKLESYDSNGGKSTRMVGDPTEGSILVAAAKAGVWANETNESYPRVNEVPFDSTRKRMITMHAIEGWSENDASPVHETEKKDWHAIIVKGAPDVVLGLCTQYQTIDDKHLPMSEEMKANILAANDRMTKNALRVLGLAYRMVPELPSQEDQEALEKDLIFAGLTGMIDPARAEVKPALETARQAGVRTIMITGDYPNTAKAIAEDISLLQPGRKVMTGSELNGLDEAAVRQIVRDTDVFARVSPENKMQIVDALRANGEVVAMTGDGVNDAPAIKRADIGVAMGITGTDVAKGAADMVLTDDNYASIVSAIEQGRIIYNNIRKFVFFLISSNMAEIMIIFLAILAGLPAPLTPIQLLWLNLLTDGAPALALAMEKGDPDVMERDPRPKNENIINGSMRVGIVIQTIAQTACVLLAFGLGLVWHLGETIPAGTSAIAYLLQHDWTGVDVQTAETMAFVTLSLCELFRAYTVRSERASVFRLGVFTNKYMQYAVAVSITLLLLVVSVPFLQPIFNTHMLAPREWLIVLGLALIPAIAEEITKFFLRQSDKKIKAQHA